VLNIVEEVRRNYNMSMLEKALRWTSPLGFEARAKVGTAE
jgi:hypothetical protein